jgi:hypothetical protein
MNRLAECKGIKCPVILFSFPPFPSLSSPSLPFLPPTSGHDEDARDWEPGLEGGPRDR